MHTPGANVVPATVVTETALLVVELGAKVVLELDVDVAIIIVNGQSGWQP